MYLKLFDKHTNIRENGLAEINWEDESKFLVEKGQLGSDDIPSSSIRIRRGLLLRLLRRFRFSASRYVLEAI